MNGGPGSDLIVAEATVDGADRFLGDTVRDFDPDTVSYQARSGAVVVDINEIADDGAVGENDLVDANTVDAVIGGSGGDTLRASFFDRDYAFWVGRGPTG